MTTGRPSELPRAPGVIARAVIVRSGRWVYAHRQEMPVDIVGLPYDFWFELARADGEDPETAESPEPLGADGLLYYVRFRHAGATMEPTWPDSSGYRTVDAAMCAAQKRVPSAIDWS